MIWVNGTSALQSDLVKYVTLTEMGSYYTNPSGHLGNGAGMALGVGIWAKDNRKIVICTIGDGEAIFGNIESVLWSIKHYNLPIIYIILNNGSWGVEWPFFTRSTKKYALNNKDTQFVDLDKPRFDFKTVGESLGIVSYRANDVKEFDSLMNELLNNKSKLPCLIELYMEKFPK